MQEAIEETKAELEQLKNEIQLGKDAEWILSFLTLPF